MNEITDAIAAICFIAVVASTYFGILIFKTKKGDAWRIAYAIIYFLIFGALAVALLSLNAYINKTSLGGY